MQTAQPDRVATVTGGSGGIGRAAATRLATDGTAVVVHYAGNKAKAEETVQAITEAGGTAIAHGGDVADESDMTALFDRAEAVFGDVDVLVHTAGIMPLAPIAELEADVFDQIQRTNGRGTFLVDQQAARRLRPGGAIINFSTSITRLQTPRYGGYAASKGAVEALILAREFEGRNITVNAVAPGQPRRPCSSRASHSRRSTTSPHSTPPDALARRRTSPRSSRSSQARVAGLTVK